jgi:amino acid transporter
VLVAGAAILSTFGTISGGMLTGPRLLLGFGDDRLLPAPFRRVHPRFKTPYFAIVVHAMVCAAFALSGTFRQLAVLSGIGTLVVYGLSCVATLVLRARDVRAEGAPFVLPGGPTIPILGAGVVIVFLANATQPEYTAAAWVFASATAVYLLRPRPARPPNE